jgi:hypothetical protein
MYSRKRKAPYQLQGVRKSSRTRSYASGKKIRAIPGYTRTTGKTKMIASTREKKYEDRTISLTLGVVDQDGHVTGSLSAVPQGTGASQRIGRKYVVTDFMCRYYINFGTESDAQQADEVVRVIFFLDKQCNGNGATPAEVLEPNPGQAVTSYLAYKNMDQNDRFVILYDKTHKMDKQAGANNGGTDVFAATGSMGRCYKKGYWQHLCTGTGATVGDLATNNISMLAISKSNKCTINAISRVRFYD